MKTADPRPKRWTEARIRAEGLQMKSVDAIMALYGCSESTAKGVLRSGQELPFPVLVLGRKRVTPTAHVLRALGLEQDELQNIA